MGTSGILTLIIVLCDSGAFSIFSTNLLAIIAAVSKCSHFQPVSDIAIEGRFLGLPSIAISLASWKCKHFETAAIIAKRLVEKIEKAPLSHNTIINVNVPDVPIEQIKGIKSTRLGNRHMSEPSIQDQNDPSLYWIGENGPEADNGEGTDFYAVNNNFVSVTPLQIDLTKYSEVERVSDWLKDLDY